MKTALGVLIFLALSIGPTVVPHCRIQALAQQNGCCKERGTLSSRNWQKNGLNLQNCKQLNGKRDGDDMNQPTGFVWWDQQC